MKIKKLNKILAVATACSGLAIVTSCNSKQDFKIIKDYLIEMPTYKTVDYDFAQEWFKTHPIKTGGCSAVVKDVGSKNSPHLIVGRNMDFAFSKKCAYVVRTDENKQNKYKTLGIAYATAEASPDFNDIKKHGISDEWRRLVPFFCTDIINEEGLYCEIDMRNIEKNEQGQNVTWCDGTNKDADIKVHMVALTRFIVNNCSNVNQAKAFVKDNIDVFNKDDEWNFSFLLADASGEHTVLEFAKNKIFWNDDANWQTNYFISNGVAEYIGINKVQQFGIGRGQYLEENLDNVIDTWSMFQLINQLSYSNVYKGRYCPFDMRSESYEVIGMTCEEVLDDSKKEEVYKKIDALMKELEGMTEEEKRQLPWYWQSTFTNVVDIPTKTFHVRMFEDKDYIFDYQV